METNNKTVKLAVLALTVILALVAMMIFSTLKSLGDRSPDSSNRETLMSLKTEDYLDRTVEEFNADFRPMYFLYDGFGRNEPEPEFMIALMHSTLELMAEEWRETTVLYDVFFCGDFEYDYELSWEADQQKTTIGKREDILRQAQNGAAAIFSSKSGDDLRKENIMKLIQAELSAMTKELSDDNMEVTVTLTGISSSK